MPGSAARNPHLNELREWHASCIKNSGRKTKMYIPIGLLILVVILLIFVF
jgi:hypothetical protein